jgi:hypothetical protein
MIYGRNVKKTYSTGRDQDSKRLKILLTIYDAALDACVQRDAERLDRAMTALQSMLCFEEWPSLGLVLYAQYNHCRELAKAGRFLEAGEVIATLRKAWTSGSPASVATVRLDGSDAGPVAAEA